MDRETVAYNIKKRDDPQGHPSSIKVPCQMNLTPNLDSEEYASLAQTADYLL